MKLHPRLGVVLIASALVGTTTTVVIAADGSPPEPVGALSDATPGPGPRTIEANAVTPRGRLSVMVYKNQAGERCIAMGRKHGEDLVAPRASRDGEISVPLKEVGLCGLHLEPVAYQLEHTPEGIVIYGLAAPDITKLTVETDGTIADATPASDDAFIVSVGAEDLSRGRPRIIATHRDGKTEVVPLPPLPSFDELNRAMRQSAKEAGIEP